jgi:hypothetical protein
VVIFRIYAEGGGEGEYLDSLFRRGWKLFFESAGLQGRLPRVVRGKGRRRTFELFSTAVANPKRGELPLLLVDSEGALQSGRSAWEHLEESDDQWQKPPSAGDDQAFLMVQVMETWFLADREMLRRFFGPNLRESHFRSWADLEAVPKATVLEVLRLATAACERKRYGKGKVSFEMLAELDAKKVAAACPHARELLDRLAGG